MKQVTSKKYEVHLGKNQSFKMSMRRKMMFSFKYFSALMLIMLIHRCSCTNQCNSCANDSQDVGKNIQGWFKTLKELSDAVGNSCLDLPQADQVRKLQTELTNVEAKCNATTRNLNLLKSETGSKISALEAKLQEVSSKLNDLTSADFTKKIRNGFLEKKGSTCELKCNDGAYPYPTKTFGCGVNDFWGKETPTCILAKSCKDVSKYVPNAQSGVYKVAKTGLAEAYDVYCDMVTDNGGWTLVAVVANGDGENWVYGDADKDYGDLTSLWESAVLLGKVDRNTPTAGKDFKSFAYVDMKGSELLVSFKGNSYIQTEKSCIGDRSMKELFNVLRFSCAGSSYNCMFGKCLGTGGRMTSTKCTHQCKVAHFYPTTGATGEPLANGVRPSAVLLKTGEANGAQDGNKDRVYISTLPYRNNVDYVPGLGSFTSLSGVIQRVDISIHGDVSKQSTNKGLFYNVYVR